MLNCVFVLVLIDFFFGSVSLQLDTKNSPLALLAQTCSAIGTDSPNPKLLAHIEKSTKSSSASSTGGREKSSPVSSQSSLSSGSMSDMKSSFKPYESNNNHIPNKERVNLSPDERDRLSNGHMSMNGVNGNRIRTPKSSSRCDSNQSATSQRDSPSMNNNSNNGMNNISRQEKQTPPSSESVNNHHHHSQNPSPHRASSKESTHASIPQESPSSRSSTSANDSSKDKGIPPTSTTQGIPPASLNGSNPYYPGYPSGLPYSMDLMTASALMSPHHPMFKAAALNPYFNYAARLKGMDPSMMQQVCKDPYCTGCPSSPHFLNKAAGQPCPPGCTQCEVGAAAAASSKSSSPYSPAHNPATAYAHAQLAAIAAASQLPYMCSWIASDGAYCGKRFSTSDELFQHLRTHTALMPDSVLSAAAAGGIPPNHPLFQRTYPTPPLSPLSTARYHPYGKPSMLPPSLAPPSLAGIPGLPPHPSLAQYFSPYSLYGPRLGSSHP